MARFINQVCEKKIVPQETANRRVNAYARLCSNGTRWSEATNIWPRATENIFLVVRLGDLLVFVS